MSWFRQPIVVPVAAGDMVGAATVTFTPTAAIAGAGSLSGSGPVTFTPAATLGGAGAVAGASAVTFTPTATGALIAAAAGVATVTFASTGAIAGTGALAGAGAVALIGAAALAGAGSMAGSATALFSPTATGDLITGMIGTATIAFSASGDLDGTGAPPVVVIDAGDFVPTRWDRIFRDRLLDEFKDLVEEILEADDPQEAAYEAVQAFAPLEVDNTAVSQSSRAIVRALQQLADHAVTRGRLARQVAEIQAETVRIAAYRRKKRNNEAALLLLM